MGSYIKMIGGIILNKKIACVGNMTSDILLRVNELPNLDDVSYVYDNTRCVGGRGAIVALVLSNLGCDCNLITSIPDNSTAKAYLIFLKVLI